MVNTEKLLNLLSVAINTNCENATINNSIVNFEALKKELLELLELKKKLKQLEQINKDALLRNVEMANELREYQSRNKYTELKRNETTNDIWVSVPNIQDR